MSQNKMNPIFVYVDDSNIESFKENQETYSDKLAFLGTSGEIMTHGEIYGKNEVFIGSEEDAPETAKIVIDTTNDDLSEIYTKEEVDELLENLEPTGTIEDVNITNDNEFLFTDNNGNVAARIGSEGVRAVCFNVVNRETGEVIGSISDKNILSILNGKSSNGNKYVLSSEDDTFYFSDLDGNVVAKINSQGIHAVGYYDENGDEIGTNNISSSATNRFTNKRVFSLCDSLGSGGRWQETFCNEVGAKAFNKDLNGADTTLASQGLTLSCGGAATLHKVTFGWDGRPSGLTSGQQRAINFVNQSVALYGDKDYLFLENINDFNFFGDEVTDEMIANPSIVDPVMIEQTYVYTNQIFSTATAARDFFFNDIETALSGFTPSVNRSVVFKYGSKKYSFNIANAATQDGIITITINGTNYVEEVLAGTTVANITQQLYEIQFIGYDNSKVDDVLSITANTVESADYTITVSTTCGCGITVEQTSSTANWSVIFDSHDVNDWLDVSKWTQNVTSMRAIMGLIEYLEQKLPKTHLIYILMPRFPFKWDLYKKIDGTPDEHTYRNLEIVKKFERFLKMQKAVCEYYNLEYVDLAHTMGWNYTNMKTWFGDGTIHWNAYAHEYIGKFLANKLS